MALAVFALTAGRPSAVPAGRPARTGIPAMRRKWTQPGPIRLRRAQADTVEPEQAGRSPAAKEPDEHASTPGWAKRR